MTRIIAGAAGSLRLEVPHSGTRPTSDRVREAMFSTLTAWNMLDGARVLDLYAGSGALGLEAASRGATEVVLVERHPPAAKIAERNAHRVTGALERAGVGQVRLRTAAQSVQTFLEQQPPRRDWDVALIDPPYDLSNERLAENLETLAPLLAPHAVVMVERSTRSGEPQWPAAYQLMREKKYGETTLWWAELTDQT